MATKRDYYQVLGIPRTASPDEIKSAFRKLAKENHPDRNPGDKGAEARFKEANEAQEVLLDEQKRAAYDRYGHAGLDPSQGMGAGSPFGRGGFQGAPDLSSIFDDIFTGMGRSGGDRGRGSDLRVDTAITLEQAYSGTKVNLRVPSSVTCEVCQGSGSESRGGTTSCATCNGQGKIRVQQGFFVMERTCATCGGSGKVIKDPCKICLGQGRVQRERTLGVQIPAGIEDGVRIRMAGEGEAGLRGSPPGDLYVHVSVKPHAMFQREDSNLYLRVPLRMTTAALGGSIEVPSIDGGRSKVTVPAGTQSGDQFRLRGKGMSILRRSERGDLYIQVQVETPVNLSKRQQELLREFEAAEGKGDTKGTSPESEGFFARVKEFFDDLGGGRS